MHITNSKAKIVADAMQSAMVWLDERGIHYYYLPPHQLKIGAINFWPGRGTITVDGEAQRRPVKGLIGLEAILGIEAEKKKHSLDWFTDGANLY